MGRQDIHGGEGAIRRLSENRELIGLACEEQEQVELELINEGRLAIVKRGAVRLEAVARLFWRAVEKAASDGDLVRLERYVKRFGWLQSASLRAWREVREEEKALGGAFGAADVLEVLHGEKQGQ